MDCRWTLLLAAAVGAVAAGCDAKTLPLWPSGPTQPAAQLPPDPSGPTTPAPTDAEIAKAAAANLVFPKVTELKPATLVAFASLRENSAPKTPAEAQENREEARKAYKRALDLDPKYVPAHLGLARLLEAQNDHEGGLASYRQVLILAPTDPRHWLEVGMCHARHKEWNLAIEHLRKAYQLDPVLPACSKALGLCLARAGQPDEALLLLIRVEGEAQAHYTVARMMHHLKRDEESKTYARQALVADPKLEGARQFLAELEGGTAPANLGVSVFQSEEK